jgi:hypothetical protein
MEGEMNVLCTKIKKTEVELKNILNILPEAVMIFDKDAKVLEYANASAMNLSCK